MSKDSPTRPNAVVCLAVFNGEANLAELLDSLITQTTNIDIVIRDDASSDGSLKLIKEYAKLYPFISIIESDQRSGSAGLNFSKLLQELVDRNNYEYYFFADQDDVWRSDKVELLLQRMMQIEFDKPGIPVLVHSDLEVVDHKLELIAQSFFFYQGLNPAKSNLRSVLVENPATGCAMAFNHQLATITSPISDKAIMHDWWFSLVAYATGAHVEVVSECLVKYRQHPENSLGAVKVGPRYYLKAAFLNDDRLSLNRYYVQVHELLASETIQLEADVREFLVAFLGTQAMGSFARLRFFMKYRIYKNDFVKNMGLLLLTLKR